MNNEVGVEFLEDTLKAIHQRGKDCLFDNLLNYMTEDTINSVRKQTIHYL